MISRLFASGAPRRISPAGDVYAVAAGGSGASVYARAAHAAVEVVDACHSGIALDPIIKWRDEVWNHRRGSSTRGADAVAGIMADLKARLAEVEAHKDLPASTDGNF